MKAYRTFVTIDDPKQIILSDVPFLKGEQVEVLFLSRNEPNSNDLQSLSALFKTTQALPQARAISDEEITAELEIFRSRG